MKRFLVIAINLYALTSFAIEERSFVSSMFSQEASDRRILQRGEIGTGRYIAGGMLGIYPGFGVGHAVQGRYLPYGAIFTAVPVALFMSAWLVLPLSCGFSKEYDAACGSRVLDGYLSLFLGVKAWEIYDVWWTPLKENERYRELKGGSSEKAWMPFMVPQKSGAVAGVAWRF